MAQVLLAKKAVWGGIKWLEFHPDGSLTTPWGKGRWGDAATAAKPSAIFAEFIGVSHILQVRKRAPRLASPRLRPNPSRAPPLVATPRHSSPLDCRT